MIDFMKYLIQNSMFCVMINLCQVGEKQKKMVNVCVVPCDSFEEANKVANYINSRSEQNNIRIVADKPRTEEGILYSLLDTWK